VYSSKIGTFGLFGILDKDSMFMGFTVGIMLILGAFLGKMIVMRMKINHFENVLELIMFAAGSSLLILALVQL
jgi:uncharacterized membrane protein YfcA